MDSSLWYRSLLGRIYKLASSPGPVYETTDIVPSYKLLEGTFDTPQSSPGRAYTDMILSLSLCTYRTYCRTCSTVYSGSEPSGSCLYSGSLPGLLTV